MNELYITPGPKYATGKIAVWWHINDCPVPMSYSAGRVRPCIERKLETLGYSLSGPLSITAYGNQNQTPEHVLRGLASSGVDIQYAADSESTYSLMCSDILEWRRHNPPPATMMIIFDMEDALFWDLVLLQQREHGYRVAVACPSLPSKIGYLDTSAQWVWHNFLVSANNQRLEDKCRELSAMFHCKSCCYNGQSLDNFRNHLSSKAHALEEGRRKPTTDRGGLGENYVAKPEYATAQIVVFWDMSTCPIPCDYDARWVRSSIESEFKKLGYSGPVSITAFGDLPQMPPLVMQGLASTEVSITHANPGPKTRRHLRKCTTERGESIAMFNCLSCSHKLTIIDEFLKHLSSKKHALEDGRIKEYWQRREYEYLHYLESLPEVNKSRKRRRMIRTDF